MRHRRAALTLGLVLGISATALTNPAAAEPAKSAQAKNICGETFTSYEDFEAVVKARPGAKVLASDATIVSYQDPATHFIWNFATKSNAAYPSVACRRIVKAEGGYRAATDISCAALEPACESLVKSYELLDKQMMEALKKR